MITNLLSPTTGNAVANQFAVRRGNKVYFQSYETMIGCYDDVKGVLKLAKYGFDGGVDLGKGCVYSTTTLKYLKVFLSDYCGYHDVTTKILREMVKDGVFYGVKIVKDIKM